MKRELRQALEDGEIPLLTSSQLRFLDEVNAFVDSKIYNDGCYFPDDDDRAFKVMSQISAIEENLGLIIKHLSGGRLAMLRFADRYPKWKNNREDSIVKLTEIASSLDSDRFNCNVTKLVGYSTSLVGGGLSLASAILIPFTFGLTTPLAIAGGIATVAGVSTAVVTSITEVALLKSKVDQAKILIEEDKTYFEDMSDWLNHASGLQEAISSVLTCNVMSVISEKIKEFVEKAVTIRSDSKRTRFIETTLDEVIGGFINIFAKSAIPILAIATVISILVAVFLLLLNTENRLVFDCASLTIRSILGVASLVDNSMDIFRLPALFAGNAAVAKAVTRGAVAVAGIALDVIGIVVTSVDMHNGSLSPEAEKITEAALKLREEADVLQTIYENLSPRVASI